jgi:ribosome-associated protein
MQSGILIGRDFADEFSITASRSSGAGGQNVNKVSTKVELRFHVASSQLLTDQEKELIFLKLAGKISLEGYLIIVSQTERSQLKNKEIAVQKFYTIIEKALTPRIKRKPTKPTKASKEKRLESKRIHAEKKISRKNPEG